jgi:hypothetical protein
MPSLPHSIPDLEDAAPTEALRRELYDAVVRVAFPKRPDPDEIAPTFSPDDGQLNVFYVWADGSPSGAIWTRRMRTTCPTPGSGKSSASSPTPCSPRGSCSTRSSRWERSAGTNGTPP